MALTLGHPAPTRRDPRRKTIVTRDEPGPRRPLSGWRRAMGAGPAVEQRDRTAFRTGGRAVGGSAGRGLGVDPACRVSGNSPACARHGCRTRQSIAQAVDAAGTGPDLRPARRVGKARESPFPGKCRGPLDQDPRPRILVRRLPGSLLRNTLPGRGTDAAPASRSRQRLIRGERVRTRDGFATLRKCSKALSRHPARRRTRGGTGWCAGTRSGPAAAGPSWPRWPGAGPRRPAAGVRGASDRRPRTGSR